MMTDDEALAQLAQHGPAGLPPFDRWFGSDGYPVPLLVSEPMAPPAAVAAWEQLDAARDVLGLHPVLTGPDPLPIVGALDLGELAAHAARAAAICADAAAIDVPALLEERGRRIGLVRPDPSAIASAAPPPDPTGGRRSGMPMRAHGPFDRPEVLTLDDVDLLLVGGPREQVAAHLQIAAGSDPPAVHAAVLRHLEQRFGATLFHACERRLTLRLPSPLTDPAELAEAYWSCALYAGGEVSSDPARVALIAGRYWLLAWG